MSQKHKPIWVLNDMFQFRTEFYGFMPIYPIIRGENNNAYYGKANQIDVFSTLLDLFCIDSEWKGLGRSLLNKTTYQDVNTEHVKNISNLIIRSNWFESSHFSID